MKEKVIVLGDSGHARSVLDILLQDTRYDVVGCLAKSYDDKAMYEVLAGIKVIGCDDILPELFRKGVHNIFIALGANRIRKNLYEKAVAIGFNPISIISPYAVISEYASVGRGTCIMPGAVINVNAKIGDGCIINTNTSIDHDCIIQDYVHIAPGTAVSGTTIIEEGVFVGTNSSVIDKVRIGKWSIVGAGAAVVKDLPENVLACGVPAQVKKYL